MDLRGCFVAEKAYRKGRERSKGKGGGKHPKKNEKSAPMIISNA